MAEEPFGRRYRQLTAALAEVIEDYGLVSYTPLAIEDKHSMQGLVALVDKATGYVYTGAAGRRSPFPPEPVYSAGLTDAGGGAAGMWEPYGAMQQVGDVHERPAEAAPGEQQRGRCNPHGIRQVGQDELGLGTSS
jgi:hypothetical protein